MRTPDHLDLPTGGALDSLKQRRKRRVTHVRSPRDAASDPQIVPARPQRRRCYAPADQGVAEGLEAVLSDNTRRVYAAQWRVFTDWCGDVDLRALPAGPLTAARYLAVCAGSGATIATLGLAAFAIIKFHQWAGHDSLAKIAV